MFPKAHRSPTKMHTTSGTNFHVYSHAVIHFVSSFSSCNHWHFVVMIGFETFNLKVYKAKHLKQNGSQLVKEYDKWCRRLCAAVFFGRYKS